MTRPLCSQEMLDVPVRFCEHFCPWRQGPYFPLRVRAGSRAMALSLLSGGLAISGHDIGRHPAALLDARYQAGGVQDPADGRGRRDVQPGLFRVPGNADRVGVPAGRGQLQTGLDDEVADLVFGRPRIAPRPAGTGLDRLQAPPLQRATSRCRC